MADGQLVPHKLPDGRTVMVPDYLLPKQPALALPNVAAPAGAPDQRTADASSMLAQSSPDFRKVMDAGNAPPPATPLAMTPVAPEEDAEARFKRTSAEKATDAAKQHMGKPAAKNLKPVPKPDPRRESGVIAETASSLYGGKAGGGAPKPVDPQNLRPVVAELKQERQPGVQLLPEQMWRMGVAPRPDFPDEIDPDAQQPTIGTEEPIRRPYKTPLERGAETAGQSARRFAEQQIADERLMGIAQQSALVQQSEALDNQLNVIADRRNRIATLQETADKRMQEAESFEPRTKAQVWEEKGPLGQIMGILAIGIGGYAQGLGRNGGRNPGWDIVNKILDDAVEGDRFKAEKRRQLGLDARNDLEHALALYGDLDMATLDAKNRKLASVMATTRQMLTNRELDMTAKERIAQIGIAAEEAYLAGKQQLFDQITGKVIKEEATLKPYGQVVQAATPKPTGGGGGAAKGISGDKLKGLSEDMIARAVKLPNGTFKFVRDRTVREKIQERVNGGGSMISTLRQIQRLREDKANTIPWNKKRGQIEALAAQLLALDKSKNQMGTLDAGLIKFMERKFGSPEQFNIVDETIDGKLEENIRLLKTEMRKTTEMDMDDGPFELTEGGVSEDVVHD